MTSKDELMNFWDSAFKIVDIVVKNRDALGGLRLDELQPDAKLKLAVAGLADDFDKAFSVMANDGKAPEEPEPVRGKSDLAGIT